MLAEADLNEQIIHRSPHSDRVNSEGSLDNANTGMSPVVEEAEAKLSLNTWRLAALTFFTVSGKILRELLVEEVIGRLFSRRAVWA